MNRRRTLSLLLVLTSCACASAGEPIGLGYTEPYRTITVSCAEPGVIAEMLVHEGEAVKKGQVLARLDTAVLAAELDIARAEADLQKTRQQRLLELAGRVTPDELQKARTDTLIKAAQVRKTEAQIEARTMRSAVDGVVTEIKRDPSEAVSTAQPHVLTVVEIDRLTINLFLAPERAAKLRTGGTAELQLLDDGAARVVATIEFLSPVIDAASGTVRVKFLLENPEGKYRAGGRCGLAD